MALSLGDINKKNPSRKPKKSNKARGRTLMPWQIPGEKIAEDNNTQTAHKDLKAKQELQTAHKQATNSTQTTHEKNEATPSTEHKLHTENSPAASITTHKQTTNSTQIITENQTVARPSANSTQTTHELHTKVQTGKVSTTDSTAHKQHTINKPLETAHKLQTPLHTNQPQPPTNRTQTTNNPPTNSTPYQTQKPHTDILQNYTQTIEQIELKLRKLSGLKLQLFDFIYNHCIQNVTTEMVMTYEALSLFSGIKSGSIKEITRRLDNKEGLLSRISPKGGRGTHTVFSIDADILSAYTKIKQTRPVTIETTHSYSSKLHTSLPPTTHEPHTPLHTSVPSKELHLKNSNLTSLFDPFEIDLTEVKSFGISEKHLQDILNQKLPLTTSKVQSLVDKFAKFMLLPENHNSVKRPPGLFVRFAQRLAQGEDVLGEIETDDDRALIKYLEQRKQAQQKRKKALDELFDLEFDCWRSEHTQQMLLDLVPEGKFKLYDGAAWNADLRNYFEQHIWPKKGLTFSKL